MKKPRFIRTKIVAGYSLSVLLLMGLSCILTVLCHGLPLMRYVSMGLLLPVMVLAGGWLLPLYTQPWRLVVIIFLPLFPILFLIFRRQWMQWTGIAYHLAMAGYMVYFTGVLFYKEYTDPYDIEQDTQGFSAFSAALGWMIGSLTTLNATIYIVFAVMLYLDYRALKKHTAAMLIPAIDEFDVATGRTTAD